MPGAARSASPIRCSSTGRCKGEHAAPICAAIDLLAMGFVDELVVGGEVLTEWPRIVGEMCGLAAGAKP
jgi:hypothetical protein